MSFKSNFKLTNRNKLDDDEEGLIQLQQNQQFLPYFENTQTTRMIKAFLDEEIKPAKYYRPLINAIESLGEGDLVYLSVNSYGGYLDGAIALINAMHSTDANVHCCIDGTAASAASLIALASPSVSVSPYASMMIHAATFGSFGKQSDVISHASFVDKQVKSLMHDIYKDFLTEQEFQEVMLGKEVWFDSEEIIQRLERRAELQKKRALAQEKEAKKSKSTPKKSN